jgi:Bacterial protein of unknown function (DUF899)
MEYSVAVPMKRHRSFPPAYFLPRRATRVSSSPRSTSAAGNRIAQGDRSRRCSPTRTSAWRPCASGIPSSKRWDSLDGGAQHIAQRVNMAVVAKSPISRITDFAKERGWHHLQLLSSAATSYNHDYFGENEKGQQPILNVFRRVGATVRHFWGPELMFAAPTPVKMRGTSTASVPSGTCSTSPRMDAVRMGTPS